MTADWTHAAVSADEAVSVVRSGMRLFVHGAAATPTTLIEALRRTDLEDVTIYHLHTAGPAPFADPAHEGRFFSVSLFTGSPLRTAVDEGRADFMPVFLSDIPSLFESGLIPLDVAFLQLSPPDRHGYCTLGTSVDAALAASRSARIVVAEINEQMPRTHGNTLVPFSAISRAVHTNHPLHAHNPVEPSTIENRIGAHVADLVPDGATLQMGIGAIPDAVLRRLGTKADLGIHTEMFSDGVMALIKSGAVTNRLKHVHKGRTVTSFVNGSQQLFDFVNDNPFIEFHPCDRTNDTAIIRRNDRVVAINSALEVDLSGQVCADSIGHRILFGHRRSDGLHQGRCPLAPGRAGDCAAGDRGQRHGVTHRPRAQARSGCRDDAWTRPLGRHRVRRGESLRPQPAGASGTVDSDRAPGHARGAHARVSRGAPRRPRSVDMSDRANARLVVLDRRQVRVPCVAGRSPTASAAPVRTRRKRCRLA
ncbi:MAG: acetyl-CoA hydrolase/transferase C-terminal domain-containing protein [Vicinamibacterales bacterium]